ncbi:MAG: type II toxin-antitoxin system VapC family toxin [Aigarchaeota archaeon]|nr:type II toxin-antitoxin system VapC family toxin [Candidatus Pelearchaeum maunauluense]
MKVYEIKSAEDLSSILKLAIELEITFYDASYIHLTKKLDAFLVSEDRELREKARNVSVKAFSILELG